MKTKELFKEIKLIINSKPDISEKEIEAYLENQLSHQSLQERLIILNDIQTELKNNILEQQANESSGIGRIISMLFGKNYLLPDMPLDLIISKIADSLNIIIDTFDQFIASANVLLYPGDKRINNVRELFALIIEEKKDTDSLLNIFEKSKKIFTELEKVHQISTYNIIEQFVINQLSPEEISKIYKGTAKFGWLRDADLYKIYCEQFNKFLNWINNEDKKDFYKELRSEFDHQLLIREDKQ